jgi:hypothetical protein
MSKADPESLYADLGEILASFTRRREGSVSSWRGKGESSLSHDSYQDAKEVGVHGGATYKTLDLSSTDTGKLCGA